MAVREGVGPGRQLQKGGRGGSARPRPGPIGPPASGLGAGEKEARPGEGEWPERVGEEKGERGVGPGKATGLGWLGFFPFFFFFSFFSILFSKAFSKKEF